MENSSYGIFSYFEKNGHHFGLGMSPFTGICYIKKNSCIATKVVNCMNIENTCKLQPCVMMDSLYAHDSA